ncbi:MAG: transglycosylase SLT domain-containing protein [Pyrinomonadaceae bacterium]|nr:transglycosylase SLT domain-containing protein [Pyrinomonadaceae bacterium]
MLFAQDSSDSHSNIKRLVESKDYEAAREKLVSLEKNRTREFTANNYDYLLGRVSEKLGDFASAAAYYQAVVNRQSILKEYALWHLAEISRSSGNLILERLYLRELSGTSERSLLREAVRKRLANSNFLSKNYELAIQQLSGKLKYENDPPAASDDPIDRKDLVLIAQAYYQSKNPEKARESYTKLIAEVPDDERPDDFALAGVKGLDLLENGEENFGKSVGKLSDDEHFLRASIYQFNRNFALARLHYEVIAKDHTKSEKRAAAMYQIGRGYDQERDHEFAAAWFARVREEYPDDKLAVSALYQNASSFANLDKTDKSVALYQQYINENPNAGNLERAYLNIIDAYRDAKNFAKALEWASRTQDKFRGGRGEAVALFSQVRIHLSRADWQDALGDLNKLAKMENLGGMRIAGGTNKQEVDFLRAFVLEKIGRVTDAIDGYLSIQDGRKEYYGGRATLRLRAMMNSEKTAKLISKKFERLLSISNQTLTNTNVDEVKAAAQNALRLNTDAESRKKLKARISRTYELIPDYQKVPTPRLINFDRPKLTGPLGNMSEIPREAIARELLFLALYDEGTPEMEVALREANGGKIESLSDFDSNTAYTLATFYKRGDVANRAVRYIEPIWKKLPRDYEISLIPNRQLELLFPKPYEEPLVKYGKEKEVDPRLVLSIMRQESRFQADVKSVAAARGLMQFISTTANKMAEEMEVDGFKQDDLYDPPVAIRFGSHYIKNIFEIFPNQPAAVAASYNAGEDRMARWFERSETDDPDRYVCEVVFTQTKDYVYKVMANYRVYQMLYDEELNRY